MSGLSDSSWISALKLPTRVMLGIFLACLILLGLDRTDLLLLDQFGATAKPLLMVLTVLSGSLAIAGIGAFVFEFFTGKHKHTLLATRRQQRREEAAVDREHAQSAVLDRIDHLSAAELRYLANCLREGSQSFYTYVHSPPVSTLMGKGLVYSPGGTHHQDHYPFTIVDFAWKFMLSRKDEILARDETNRRKEAEAEKRGRR